MKMIAVFLPLALAATVAQAQERIDSIPPVKLTLDLGYINAAGNTNLSTLSTGENLEYRAERFELLQSGSIIYGRNDDATVTEQMKTGGRLNFLAARVLGV